MLRTEVQRTSVRQSKEENVYSRGSSPSSSKFDGLRNSRSFQEDQSQKLIASKGSNKYGSDYKIPPSTRGTSTNKLQKQMKTISTQCDFMLENIVDTNNDDENEKEALKEEILSLREEVYNLKVFRKFIEKFFKVFFKGTKK